MKFDFRDSEKFISHWMLNDHEIAKKISATPEFKENLTTIAKVTVNGVELSFESLEELFKQEYDRTVAAARAEFADLDKEVERRLKKRLEEEAQAIIDKMHRLSYALENVEDAVKPYWEKKDV